MSLTELSSDSPYRSNESGIRACRDATLAAWEFERATDAQLLMPIVARRWALAFTAPIATILCLVAIFARDWELLCLPGLLVLPSFLVLSWAARLVLGLHLARPLRASPLDRLSGLAARLAPWARSSAMILGAFALFLVSGALGPFEGRGGAVEVTMVFAGYTAIFGMWTVPTLIVRAVQIGVASPRRGCGPLTFVCALIGAGLSLLLGPFGVLVALACGAMMYGVFALVVWIVRRRFERHDALVAALLSRRAAASAQ